MSGFVNLKLINRYSIYAESTGGFSVIKQAGDSNGDAGNEDYVSDEVGNTNFHTYADAVDALRFDLWLSKTEVWVVLVIKLYHKPDKPEFYRLVRFDKDMGLLLNYPIEVPDVKRSARWVKPDEVYIDWIKEIWNDLYKKVQGCIDWCVWHRGSGCHM